MRDLNERKREVIRSGLDAIIRLSITGPEAIEIELNELVLHDNAEWIVSAVNRADLWVQCDLVLPEDWPAKLERLAAAVVGAKKAVVVAENQRERLAAESVLFEAIEELGEALYVRRIKP